MLAMHAILSVVRDVGAVAVRINAMEATGSPTEIGVTLTLLAAPAYLALLAALVLLGRAVLFGRSEDTPPNHSRSSGKQVAA